MIEIAFEERRREIERYREAARRKWQDLLPNAPFESGEFSGPPEETGRWLSFSGTRLFVRYDDLSPTDES